MPFSDPMADGPVDPGGRATGAEARHDPAQDVGDGARACAERDPDTPYVLMGYYNPIYRYGAEAFARDAVAAGVDGAIVVDLPPEEDAELAGPARAAGLDIVRLATPTSDEARLPAIVAHASGFIYYVAIAGITGTRSADAASVRSAVARLRRFTELPIAVGFGIKTPAQAAEVAEAADAAVVGSASSIASASTSIPTGTPSPASSTRARRYPRALAAGGARKRAPGHEAG